MLEEGGKQQGKVSAAHMTAAQLSDLTAGRQTASGAEEGRSPSCFIPENDDVDSRRKVRVQGSQTADSYN